MKVETGIIVMFAVLATFITGMTLLGVKTKQCENFGKLYQGGVYVMFDGCYIKNQDDKVYKLEY